VPERDVCLVVSASSWFEISEGSPGPDPAQAEYRLRGRILVEGAQSIVAHIFGLADTSGRFRRLVPPLLSLTQSLSRSNRSARRLRLLPILSRGCFRPTRAPSARP
jgi:hypothetical protein